MMSIQTDGEGTIMDDKQIEERLQAVETAQAAGAATLAGIAVRPSGLDPH